MDGPDFTRRQFAPGIAGLDFSIELPDDWTVHALPPSTTDVVADPSALVALAAVSAPHAAVVLAVAARPAYDDGSVADWARFLLEQHGVTPRAVGDARLGGLDAIVGEAAHASELGPLVVRFAFAEDGGRLIHLSLTAPALFADAVAGIWQQALASFELAAPRGPRAPLHPAPAPVGPYEPLAGGLMTAHALADDDASLDPEHPINASLRAQGEGFAPPVVAVDAAARCAIVASPALQAQLPVPFGWHPLDDGRRLRLLDPGGDVQLSLSLIATEGRGAAQVLDAIEAQVHDDYPAPQCLRIEQGAMRGLGVRNIADGDQPLEQFHLLVPGPDEGTLLRARVTSTPEQAVQAANLGEAMLAHVRFGAAAAA